MSAKLKTAGEQLLGRRLVKEKRAGVDHYYPGQYRARRIGSKGLIELSYVDDMGHACLLLLERDEGRWFAIVSARAGQASSENLRYNPSVHLSAEALKCLKAVG